MSGLGLETVRVIMVAISNPPPLAWNIDCPDGPSDTCRLPQVAQVTAFSSRGSMCMCPDSPSV